jgi:hypothetical protein
MEDQDEVDDEANCNVLTCKSVSLMNWRCSARETVGVTEYVQYLSYVLLAHFLLCALKYA